MSNINPKILEKFKTYGVPDSYLKLIKKILEAEHSISKNRASKSSINDSYSHILNEFVEDEDILKYINEQEKGGS